MIIHETWQAHSYARELDERVVFSTKLSDFLSNLVQKCCRIRPRVITDASDDTIVEITQGQNGFISSNIDAEQSEALAVEAKRRRRLTTDRRSSSRTLFDDA